MARTELCRWWCNRGNFRRLKSNSPASPGWNDRNEWGVAWKCRERIVVCRIGLELFRGGGDLDFFLEKGCGWVVLWALVWSWSWRLKFGLCQKVKKMWCTVARTADVLFCRCSLTNFVSPLFLPPFENLPSNAENFIYNGTGRDLVMQQPIWDDSVLPQQI